MKTELELLELASHKHALFVGEKIVDVYHYVKPLGKASKDTVLSVEHQSTETFEGGMIAARKHAEGFCAKVDWHTGGKALRKERWVEGSHLRKLFEVYVTDGQIHSLVPPVAQYDVVVVCDYGQGMMTEEFVDYLAHNVGYLAVNVQTNSGNYGFNLATKYAACDYLCVDEPEARLATQNRAGPLEDSLRKLSQIAPKVCITLGKAGAVGLSLSEGIVRVASFTETVVDTIGAGDAFFAITALVAQEADMKSLLRIGNAAGAIKAGIVGHRTSVTKNELIGYLAEIPV